MKDYIAAKERLHPRKTKGIRIEVIILALIIVEMIYVYFS